MSDKGPAAFRTISEASTEVGVPSHVLRFWETRFSFVRPMKRAGGRRFYRPQDLQVLRGVRTLLHEEGYTIKAVQKLHKEEGVGRLVEAAAPAGWSISGDRERPAAAAPGSAQADLPSDAVGEPGGPGLLLAADARHRLTAVLADLQSVKARVDALLGSPPTA